MPYSDQAPTFPASTLPGAAPNNAQLAAAGFVTLGSLFQPIDDVLPASEILTDQISTSAQAFSALATVPWTAKTAKFNLQGQNWIQASAGSDGGGQKNDTSARNNGGVPWGMVTEFEFMYTADKFDLMLIGQNGGFDCQIYVEYQGGMRKLRDKPLGSTTTGYVFRNVKFAATPNGAGGAVARGGWKGRRIRVVIGGNVNFLQLNVEAAALVYPSPQRPMGIVSGSDSFFEPLHAQNAGSDETYFCMGNAQGFFEATQIVLWNGAEGGTGLFQNGDGTARGDDTGSSINASRFGSAQRRAKIAAGYALGAADPLAGIRMPLFDLFHGTINDGQLSGLGTGVASAANMKARAKVCYQAALDADTAGLIRVVHVGPEPYTLSNPAASTPGYDASGPHYVNRLAQIDAINELNAALATPRAYFIDASNPTAPWWTGNGYNNNGENPQAVLTGADGIHGNYRQYVTVHSRRIADNMRSIPVPARRAYRQA